MKFIRQFRATYKALHSARALLGRDDVSKILNNAGREARRRGLDRTASLAHLALRLRDAERAERLARLMVTNTP